MAMFHPIKNQSKEIVWVNFDLVKTMQRNSNYTRIAFHDGTYVDTDTPPEDILIKLPKSHQSEY